MKSAYPPKLDMEEELSDIRSRLSADNYVVKEMTEDDLTTRKVLYNRFRKWIIENDRRSAMFGTVSD